MRLSLPDRWIDHGTQGELLARGAHLQAIEAKVKGPRRSAPTASSENALKEARPENSRNPGPSVRNPPATYNLGKRAVPPTHPEPPASPRTEPTAIPGAPSHDAHDSHRFPISRRSTFGLRSTARRYAEAASLEDLRALFADARLNGEPVRLLGGRRQRHRGPHRRRARRARGAHGHGGGGASRRRDGAHGGRGRALGRRRPQNAHEGWGGMEGLAAVPGTVGGAVVRTRAPTGWKSPKCSNGSRCGIRKRTK